MKKVIDSYTGKPIKGIWTYSTWKTKDGEIVYNPSEKVFTWIGEGANKAMHEFNRIAREYQLTVEQRDEIIIKTLDKNCGKVNVYEQ